MKKLILLIMVMALAALGYSDVIIGTQQTTSNTLPINCYYGYSYTQQIYTAAQIGTAMTITGVKFYYSSGSTTNSSAWTVRVGHTTKTGFVSTSDW